MEQYVLGCITGAGAFAVGYGLWLWYREWYSQWQIRRLNETAWQCKLNAVVASSDEVVRLPETRELVSALSEDVYALRKRVAELERFVEKYKTRAAVTKAAKR